MLLIAEQLTSDAEHLYDLLVEVVRRRLIHQEVALRRFQLVDQLLSDPLGLLLHFLDFLKRDEVLGGLKCLLLVILHADIYLISRLRCLGCLIILIFWIHDDLGHPLV